MRYHGKNIDTFEDALSMLYKNNGYTPEKYADCISGRAFIFQVKKSDRRNWISSKVSPADAISRVALYNNLLEETSIFYNREDFWQVMKRGCLLGPVDMLTQNEIQTFYFNGKKRYLYICGYRDGMYVVHDPEGFPEQLYEKDELLKEYDFNQSIAVEMRAGGNQKRSAFMNDIIKEQLAHRRIEENWDREGDIESWMHFEEGRKKDLALQYGLSLYLQQIGKVVQVLEIENVCNNIFCKEIERALEKLYRCVLDRDISRFLLWRERLWETIEKSVGV